jgi:hypothetical protein
MVSLREGQTTFLASVDCLFGEAEEPTALLGLPGNGGGQAGTGENSQHAQDHRLLGEEVKASDAGHKQQYRQRKLEFYRPWGPQ